MIIQIRGTSGSGKSTVMTRLMDSLTKPYQMGWKAINIEGRRKPLYYVLDNLIVLGHYETPCGGCDTIGSAAQVFKVIQELRETYPDHVILCEGLLLSEDVKWSSQLEDLHVFYLTTPLETCLGQIEQRRKKAGNNKPLNPNNTANRVAVIERSRVKLKAAGVSCRRVSARQAVQVIRNQIYK